MNMPKRLYQMYNGSKKVGTQHGDSPENARYLYNMHYPKDSKYRATRAKEIPDTNHNQHAFFKSF
jgi:hypothetical protein